MPLIDPTIVALRNAYRAAIRSGRDDIAREIAVELTRRILVTN